MPQAKKLVKVFPAYAGMFLRELVAVLGPDGFPRIRGDVPPPPSPSPRLRKVFPAYAGMFQPPTPHRHPHGGFPRIRGDVPSR